MSKKKILIIDDEPSCLTSLSMQLYNSEFELVLFDNGQEAVDLLERGEKIDLILLDLMMPRMDGFEFLDILRERKLFNNKPVILQTGLIYQEQIDKALKKGAIDVLTKPFSKEALISKIKKYL